ncbi:hypothetical protein HW555_000800 [Spodoptera exigua]|uniref:Uncharacterized protein n=1 Tax=Spodoptera exigua TaxID=7107 RepID=A0A835GU60_SPOEX|nr:hypothetical protein HW555_000800 [Spodoptera exigua]
MRCGVLKAYREPYKTFTDLDMLETSRRSNRRRYRRNPFESSEEDFRYKYRFTKRFGAKIVDILREDLCHDPRGCPLSPELQVVCALRNWARHEIQDDTADLHGVSQPVVSKSCKMVIKICTKKGKCSIQENVSPFFTKGLFINNTETNGTLLQIKNL